MRRHYLVEGAVQGVGFRFFTRREAARLGITGWVRNTGAGHVEVLADGPADKVAAFEAALARGPMTASVTTLRVLDTLDETIVYMSFEVID